MKRIIFSIALVLAIACSLRADETNAAPKEAPKEAPKDESRVSHDTNGNAVVKLDAETQKLIALKVEPLSAAQLAPEMKVYGRVLDPAPLAALITELATSQAAYAASSNELARLKNLSTSGNASARALQAAEASELHDHLQIQSAHDRLVMAWGKWVTEEPDLPAFIQSLTSLDNVLIRLDLSAGQQLPAQPSGARVIALSGASTSADVLGHALAVDPQTQGEGLILQIKGNELRFLVNEAVIGYLKMPGEPLAGVIVPRSTVVRAQGAPWVYVQTADDQFTRKEIQLDHPVENGWFVTNSVAAGDKLVVTGAQTLLSEELKGALGAPSD